MTEVEQLLWAMIYRVMVKSDTSKWDSSQAANDAVDNFRAANLQDS